MQENIKIFNVKHVLKQHYCYINTIESHNKQCVHIIR